MALIWGIVLVLALWIVLASLMSMGADADEREAERRKKDRR